MDEEQGIGKIIAAAVVIVGLILVVYTLRYF